MAGNRYVAPSDIYCVVLIFLDDVDWSSRGGGFVEGFRDKVGYFATGGAVL